MVSDEKEAAQRERQHPELPLSKDLQWFLWHGPAQALMTEQVGTWNAGLCWILAEGILRWITLSRALPPTAVFLMIVGGADCPAHHVVVCLRITDGSGQEQCWYLDAYGVNTQETLLRYWQQEEGLTNPFLAPYNEQLLLELGIRRDGCMSTRLAECFFETFGRFSLTFLEAEPMDASIGQAR
jgi:hypothetical protein